jgi:DNA primase
MIPDSAVEAVKARIDGTRLLGRHLDLRRSGSGFIAACPFHEDRRPSLRFYPESARFQCFGCGAHGDVVAFLQRISGKSFPAVIRELAQEVGVDLGGTLDPAERDRQEVVAACAAAQGHFQAALSSEAGAPARAYLKALGISEGTARAMHLGFSTGELAGSSDERAAKGLRLAGLLVERNGAPVERFQGRLTLPLHDATDRVLGFTARAVSPRMVPRYLTTPENVAFRPSRVLFGLEPAGTVVRRIGRALFVPTYFDVLACQDLGIAHAVSGSGLSAPQLRMLRQRGAAKVTVIACGEREFEPSPEFAAEVFLSDSALWVSTAPASAERTGSAMGVRGLGGRTGVEALEAHALPLSEYLIERALRRPPSAGARVEGRVAAIAWLARYTAAVPDGLERDILERRISQRLGLPLRTVRQATREVAKAVLRVSPRVRSLPRVRDST